MRTVRLLCCAAALSSGALAINCAEPSSSPNPEGGGGGGASTTTTGAGGADAGQDGDDIDVFVPDTGTPDVDIGDGCVSATVQGELVPLDMLILQDRSGSMTSGDRWEQATTAIKGFADSPSVAGMNLGLAYFPPKVGDECQPATYETLPVPITPLPGNAGPIKQSLNSTSPSGLTPMRPALEGATQAMTDFLSQNPNHEGIVILVTDGDPAGCSNNTVSSVAASAAAALAATPSVRTFAIGMEGASFGSLDTIAAAGGTVKSFDVSGANAQAELAAALEEIRSSALSCTYVLPVPTPAQGTLDLDSVEVQFVPGLNEPAVPINKVDGPASCGEISGGFYYDDPVMPTQILLCPASCELVQSGSENASVKVVLGCIVPPPD